MASLNKIFYIFLLHVVLLWSNPVVVAEEGEDDMICEEDLHNVTLCTHKSNDSVPDPCNDQSKECSFWAEIGECDVNPNYMLSSCAKSCKQCPSYVNGLCEYDDMSIDYGMTQIQFGTKTERRKIGSKIKELKQYADKFSKQSDTTVEMRESCRNELSKCTFYATNGLCESRVVFMMNNCVLACMMCDRKQQFDECVGVRHPHSIPFFISHDEFEAMTASGNEEERVDHTVDSYFKSLRRSMNPNDGQTGFDYIIQAESDEEDGEDWIVKFDNFLSTEESNDLIKLGNDIGFELKKDGSKTKYNSFKVASCSNSMHHCDAHDTLTKVMERVSQVASIPLDNFEPVEVTHYPESNGYKSLHQNGDIHDDWKMAGHRVISFYIPLSTVEDGGYLGFPSFEWLMIPPVGGQMIAWPNVLNTNPTLLNDRMSKEVLPVRKGDLYILELHAHQYDFKVAQERGCV